MVLDTSVVVAAMRSPTGASAEIVRSARRRAVTLVGTVALALEYEAVCSREEHWIAAGLSGKDAGIFVDAMIALLEPVETWFLWRPQLRDPGDEFVLEVAVNGGANAIVTFNQRDFAPAATRFGIEVLLPREVVRRCLI